jgi:ABC-type phosphate transport system auxiliary subunit
VKDDEVPERDRSLSVECDGVFVLDIEGGYADPARLSEFHDDNTALKRQIEELTQPFEGIDVAEVRKVAAEKKRLEEESALKAGEFDKVLNARVAAATGELQKQLQSLGKERDGLNERRLSRTGTLVLA